MTIYHFAAGRKALAVAGCALLLAGGVQRGTAAVTWKDLQFGGFASQGYLTTSANDYIGQDFDFREYGLNGSFSHDRWRLGAQVFGQKLGDYGHDRLKLDWATIDFQASQQFGVRAGRVKMPRGLYNEVLDLDALRPYVLLPQGVYDPRLRDFHASFDGAMAYGTIGIGAAGSLDYRLFYGDIPIARDSGANDYFNNDVPDYNGDIGMRDVYGGTLFWNLPVAGLRVGYSFNSFNQLHATRYRPPDTVLFAVKETDHYQRHLVSAEYTTGDWTFAAEAGEESAFYNARLSLVPGVVATIDSSVRTYYVAASRRFNRWLEVGAYYNNYRQKEVVDYIGLKIVDTVRLPQDDYALSVRFDANDHLIFKVEGHLYDGSGKIFDTYSHRQPLSRRENSWSMIAIKATTYF